MVKRRRGGARERGGPSEDEAVLRVVADLGAGEERLAELGLARRRGESGPTEEERRLRVELRAGWERAHEAAVRAVHGRPDRAGNHVSLGMCLQGLGRYDEAEAAYREAIRLEPGNGSLPDLLAGLEMVRAGARGRRGLLSWLGLG